MFQLDDKFLESVGLGALPDDQKKAFLKHIYDQLELRVGTKLSEGLSEAQMREFESFIDYEKNAEAVETWLQQNIADYATRPDYQNFAKSAPANVPEIAIKAEYASLRWLELNRPDYRQVVADTIEEIRKEISANKDAILGAA